MTQIGPLDQGRTSNVFFEHLGDSGMEHRAFNRSIQTGVTHEVSTRRQQRRDGSVNLLKRRTNFLEEAMTTTRSAKRAIAALCIAALAAAIPVASATAQISPPPITVIGPGGSAALVVPTVDCAIRTPLGDTYWFGYVNSAGYSITVPVGASNKIPRTSFRRTSNDAAQPDQFRPGTTARSVAVQVGSGSSVTWTVSSYTATGELLTASATASAATPACAAKTSPNSVNVRVGGASISFAPDTQTRDAAGRLIAATVKFSATGQRTVCSAGGVPQTPTTFWGWVDEFGVPASTQAAFYAPLPASEVVRVDTFATSGRFGAGTVSFQRTVGSVRTVVDPQRVVSQLRSDGVTMTSYGWSLVVPTVDLTGVCTFGLTNVKSPGAYIGGEEGQFSYSITDPATQTTRKPVFCTFGVATCDVLQEVVGPGGLKISR
jgi:hypothetical protein